MDNSSAVPIRHDREHPRYNLHPAQSHLDDRSRSSEIGVHNQRNAHDEFATAVNGHLGKQRVSIMLDGSIIAFFKAKAGERGYQTLINQALHQAMTGEQIESTLRRVIREELHTT